MMHTMLFIRSGGGLFGGASTPVFGAPSAASPFGGTSTPAFGTPGATLFPSFAADVLVHVRYHAKQALRMVVCTPGSFLA
jgi:hypothetical protein